MTIIENFLFDDLIEEVGDTKRKLLSLLDDVRNLSSSEISDELSSLLSESITNHQNWIKNNKEIWGFPELFKIGEYSLKMPDGQYVNFPKLVEFDGIGAIEIMSETKDIDFLAEISLAVGVRLISGLPNNLVKIRGIAFEEFGMRLRPLLGLNTDIYPGHVTNEQQLVSLICEIETRISEIGRKCLFESEDLISFNKTNKKIAEPFFFVFLPEPLILQNEDTFVRLHRLCNSTAAAKAGIYFIVCNNAVYHDSSDVDISKIENQRKVKRYFPMENFSIKISVNNSSNINNDFIDIKRKVPIIDILENIPSNLKIDIVDTVDLGRAFKFFSERTFDFTARSIQIPKNEWFSRKSNKGISIPIGWRGDELINFTLGLGSDNYGALIGGNVGSGKSILLHNLIVNGALLYSPEELEFILLDYKEGTEFKKYINLPHAKILGISSETKFGLDTFQFINDEIKNRGEKFKELDVANIDDYKSVSNNIMPRWIIIVDEFQRLTSVRNFSRYLDDVVRRGRSFGIHPILSTQSVLGLTIEEATKSNLSLRICLKIAQREVPFFLSHDNDVPTKFRKPGQAIYNPYNGSIDGNIEMQVAYLSNEDITKVVDEINNNISIDSERYIFNGESYVEFNQNKYQESFKNSTNLLLSPGTELNVPQTLWKIDVSSKGPEKILIIGSRSKSNNIINTFISQLNIQQKDSGVILFDFSESSEYNVFSENCHLIKDIDQSLIELSLLIKEQSEVNSNSTNVVIFFCSTDSYSLRKKTDPATGAMSNSPLKDLFTTFFRNAERLGILVVACFDKYELFDEIILHPGVYNSDAVIQLGGFHYRIILDNVGVSVSRNQIGNTELIDNLNEFNVAAWSENTNHYEKIQLFSQQSNN